MRKKLKGKDTFTSTEIAQLKELIELRNRTESSLQGRVRNKMRGIGFYGRDDWGIVDLKLNDLEKLIRNGGIKVSDYDLEKQEAIEKKDTMKEEKAIKKNNRDEYYVLDLCDEVLGIKSSRQHKFDFLLGDPNKSGKCRKLPVDAYYVTLNLVIEYRERQHTESVKHFDKPDKITVSGVPRVEQRKIYDERRQKVLRANNINLIEISYYDFEYDSKKRIKRNNSKDIETIKRILKYFIK
ncbi:MAG: hypothetical protein WBJ84_08785 [Bacteroidales bacterium]